MVVPHGHAKPGSDSEATKETASIVIPGGAHLIFCVCSVVAEHNELLHFVFVQYRVLISLHLLRRKLSNAALLIGYM